MATKYQNRAMYLSNGEDKSKLMEKYSFIKEIGSGSFGKVFLVKSKQQGINYVIKKVDLKKLDKKQILSASKEVEFLAKLRHNNIVSYKESFEKNNELNIVLEYCENGDLHNKIKEKRITNKFFGENEVFDYFVQISLALEYIHSHKILHRDLKTKNIFLTKGNVIKLGDFGIAKTLENSFELVQTCIGSPFYLSPEICESKPYNKKSDVWALGCVLYEIATLRYAFVAKNVKTLVTKILAGAYNPLPTNMNVHIRSLISCMLKPNPVDRPSVREILEKRFLIKRRATFICKAHRSNSYKCRSKSGDRNLSAVVVNDIQKNNLNMRKLSVSCLQLNHFKEQKKFNISNPRAKYGSLNNCLKNDKKLNFMIHSKIENKAVCPGVKQNSSPGSETQRGNRKHNPDNVKQIKLTKVDSQYYDLIAGHDRKEEHFEKNASFVGKQTQDEIEESCDLTRDNLGVGKGQIEEYSKKSETVQEYRKKWSKNTLERKALLDFFNESELLENSLTQKLSAEKSGSLVPAKTVDDMLSLNPSEITEDVLQPVQVYNYEPSKRILPNNLLQQEITHLKEKFEMNSRRHQMEDLIRLTINSKNILKLENRETYLGRIPVSDCERGSEESVYHDLECLRMSLEQKIGFSKFSQAYGKMINIINDDSNLKCSLEKGIDPTRTYVIRTVDVSGDGDDLIKSTWKSIVGTLGDKQEHLPDIWELAMSEHIYYHL